MFSRIAQHYKESTAVVIGAGGIGAAIVELLAANVANLVVADRDQAMLDGLAASVGSGQLLTQKLDVRDHLAVSDFFEFIKTTVGTPHYLFYAAGILNVESLAETSSDIWDRAVDINLNGA